MKDFEESVKWHQQYCRHYRAPLPYKHCEVGVVYDDLMRVAELGRTGCMLRLPCIRSHHQETERRGEPLCECPKLEWTSRGEAEKSARDHQASVERLEKTLELIGAVKERHKGADWNGVEVCPVCKGNLAMSHSAYNGHVWGKCETEGCVSWME